MPNWCEGTLKVRGKLEDVKRWVKENLSVYRTKFENGKENLIKDIDGVEVIDWDDGLDVNVKGNACIAGTQRHFIQKGTYTALGCEDIVLCMDFEAAWAIDIEPFAEMSKTYNVDLRLYGCEQGMEFCQEIIVEQGKITKNDVIRYDNYKWECPFPNLGG